MASPPVNVEPLRQVRGLAELVTLAAGCSFGDGLLRVFTDDEARRAQSLVSAMFPERAVRIRPFAQDWLGRQYVLDLRRSGMLLLIEPGSGGVYELDEEIPELFDLLMVDEPDTFLALDLFSAWREVHPEAIPAGKCVGFGTPLFLGGDGAVANLEVIDEEVYWSIHGQLWAKIKDLPPGTSIDSVQIR
ncbi:hypothetical protein ACIA8G_36570 [Lentzea sp. NPDC051213]|uniref:hypothetical protein n=1 Tax=Lentzea sp. NPDC051213 TaxID=3364126 RepID=UPI00379E388F